MLTKEYENGAEVLVTIKAKVGGRAQGPSGPLLELRTDDGRLVTRVWPGSPGVTVERLAPPEPEVPEWFPPAAGSVVRAGDGEHLMRTTPPESWPAAGWVSRAGLSTDANLLKRGTPTLLFDAATAAEPLHTWPPTEPGQWFEDDAGEQCVSVRGESDVYVIFPSSEYPHARYRLDTTQRARGPMKPIPAPGGASC